MQEEFFFYIRAVQVHTDYQFYCVPERGSWNGSFIIVEVCIHQQLKALFFQVRYVELYGETGSKFPVDAGFLRVKSPMAAAMLRYTVKWTHVFVLINKHCLGIVFSLFFSVATMILYRSHMLSWYLFLEQYTT